MPILILFCITLCLWALAAAMIVQTLHMSNEDWNVQYMDLLTVSQNLGATKNE